MDNLLHIYFVFLGNFINTFLVFRFAEINLKQKIQIKDKIMLLCIDFIYSVIPEKFLLPTLPNIVIALLFLLYIARPNLKQGCFIFIKFEIYSHIIPAIILFTHSLIFNDFNVISVSSPYETYKVITTLFLSYVFYVLYTNYKKNRRFHTRYHIYFNVVIFAVCLLLSYSTLYICRREPDSQTLPLLFTTLIILIILCISLYDKFLTLTEENAGYKIQMEINRLQKDYAVQAEETLKDLRSIRHDIKNHLIIIDGYARLKNFEKIREYIHKIHHRFSEIPLIQTPSVIVSAILNEKSELARQKGIPCKITCDFTHMSADDFSMTTILGNLLDNALTAASKCPEGWMNASLRQVDSSLIITIDNSHAESISEKNGVFASTKSDQPHLHGIGIKNVRKAVKDLNGQIEVYYTDDVFHVGITLPNYA